MKRFGALAFAMLVPSAGGFIEAGHIPEPSAAAAAHWFYVAGIIIAIFFATARPAEWE
jgi:hypothetical protein